MWDLNLNKIKWVISQITLYRIWCFIVGILFPICASYKIINSLIPVMYLALEIYWYLVVNGDWVASQTTYLFLSVVIFFTLWVSIYFSVVLVKAFNLVQSANYTTSDNLPLSGQGQVWIAKSYKRVTWLYISLYYIF